MLPNAMAVSKVKVVPLTGWDWQRAKHIRLRALADTPNAFGSTLADEDQFTEEEWRSRLTPDDRVTYVAEKAGQDVGLVVCAPFEGQPDTAGLFSMWTAPDARRQGVGCALIQAVIAWAMARGYKQIALDVADANTAAIAAYTKMGFAPTGETGTLPPPRSHITEHRRRLTLT